MKRKKVPKKAVPRKRVPAELSEFDREMVIESFSEPPAVKRAKWQRAAAKRGRPRQGAGATVISVSVEQSLLQRADLTARRLGITRSELIARGLRAALAATGTP
jgi:hypothetical protein